MKLTLSGLIAALLSCTSVFGQNLDTLLKGTTTVTPPKLIHLFRKLKKRPIRRNIMHIFWASWKTKSNPAFSAFTRLRNNAI